MKILLKFLTAGHLVHLRPCPAAGYLDTACFFPEIWILKILTSSYLKYLARDFNDRINVGKAKLTRVIINEKKDHSYFGRKYCSGTKMTKLTGSYDRRKLCLTCVRRFDWFRNNGNIEWPMRWRARECTDSTCTVLPNRNDTNTAAMRDENEEVCQFSTLSLSAMSKEVSLTLEFIFLCCWILVTAEASGC